MRNRNDIDPILHEIIPSKQMPGADDLPTTDTPFEAIPALATNNVFIEKMTRLRELKTNIDKDSEEFEGLKREVAAMAAVNGIRSLAYYDLRISDRQGRVMKGKIFGETFLDTYQKEIGHAPSAHELYVIAESAKELDPIKLVEGGISPVIVAHAKAPDGRASNSIVVEWIGAKGKGGKAKRGPAHGAGEGQEQ